MTTPVHLQVCVCVSINPYLFSYESVCITYWLVGGVMTTPYNAFYTDIQLKTLSQRIEVFNMKIIMRRDHMIF